jgi:hypothetical protein
LHWTAWRIWVDVRCVGSPLSPFPIVRSSRELPYVILCPVVILIRQSEGGMCGKERSEVDDGSRLIDQMRTCTAHRNNPHTYAFIQHGIKDVKVASRQGAAPFDVLYPMMNTYAYVCGLLTSVSPCPIPSSHCVLPVKFPTLYGIFHGSGMTGRSCSVVGAFGLSSPLPILPSPGAPVTLGPRLCMHDAQVLQVLAGCQSLLG